MKRADELSKEEENLRALAVGGWNKELYNLATKRLATISALKDYAKFLGKKRISGTKLLIVIGLSLGENDNIEDYQ